MYIYFNLQASVANATHRERCMLSLARNSYLECLPSHWQWWQPHWNVSLVWWCDPTLPTASLFSNFCPVMVWPHYDTLNQMVKHNVLCLQWVFSAYSSTHNFTTKCSTLYCTYLVRKKWLQSVSWKMYAKRTILIQSLFFNYLQNLNIDNATVWVTQCAFHISQQLLMENIYQLCRNWAKHEHRNIYRFQCCPILNKFRVWWYKDINFCKTIIIGFQVATYRGMDTVMLLCSLLLLFIANVPQSGNGNKIKHMDYINKDEDWRGTKE